MYWCSRGLTITVTGPEGCSTVKLSKPFARVGSRVGSEIVLSRELVGSRAAYFHATNDAIWCLSLGRSQTLSAKPVRLRPGTQVHLGPYRLKAAFADAFDSVDSTEIGTSLSTREQTPLSLTFSSSGTLHVGHVLSEAFTLIGRGPPSNLVFRDERLSRVHCLLYRCKDRLWVIDLLSSNGTRFEGRRVEAASVRPGERVGMGDHSFRYGTAHQRWTKQSNGHIVEQTIVRERSEQIITRVVENDVCFGGNYEWPNGRGMNVNEGVDFDNDADDALNSEPAVVEAIPADVLSNPTTTRTIEIRCLEPPRITEMGKSVAVKSTLSRTRSLKIINLKGEAIQPRNDSQGNSDLGSASAYAPRSRYGIAVSARATTKSAALIPPCSAGPSVNGSSDRYEQVLDRLIDKNRAQLGPVAGRIAMASGIAVGLGSLVAIVSYLFGVFN